MPTALPRVAPRSIPGFFALLSLLASGCGSASVENPLPNIVPHAPVITVQPASATVPLGQFGTFSVTVSGTSPLTYQWSENGQAISGATAPSYTTPIVVPGDAGSTYTVVVSNPYGSASSQNAMLSVGPRSPLAGDLRFQQVDAPSTVNGYSGDLFTNLNYRMQWSFTNIFGTPLFVGPRICSPNTTDPLGCGYLFGTFFLPGNISGLNSSFLSDVQSNFAMDLQSVTIANTVVTSIDLEPRNSDFAYSTAQTATGGRFSDVTNSVAPADFQAAATNEGAAGRVITAVSYDSGQIYYLSYGWTGDIGTIYDSQIVLVASSDQVPAAAANLATQGYILTAFGSGDTGANGFILVGTRVHGDSLPRPFKLVPRGIQTSDLIAAGYAVVGVYFDASENEFWIGEK